MKEKSKYSTVISLSCIYEIRITLKIQYVTTIFKIELFFINMMIIFIRQVSSSRFADFRS